MKCSIKIAAFLSTIILTNSVCAESTTHVCPSTQALQRVQLSEAYEIDNHFYLSQTLGFFDTQERWLFIIGPILADSMYDATIQSNALLQQVSGHPTAERGEELWFCKYQLPTKKISAVALYADGGSIPMQYSLAPYG